MSVTPQWDAAEESHKPANVGERDKRGRGVALCRRGEGVVVWETRGSSCEGEGHRVKNHEVGGRSAVLVSIREGRGDCGHHMRDGNNK